MLFFAGAADINAYQYETGSYSPTPTIIEAAVSLYNKHTVKDITKNAAEAKNLAISSIAISEIIRLAKSGNKKMICFVTGVPGGYDKSIAKEM